MPALLDRRHRSTMAEQVRDQIADCGEQVEFFSFMDNGPLSTGEKRYILAQACVGEYICHVDDDDRLCDDYLQAILSAIYSTSADVITFDHSYNVGGKFVAKVLQVPKCIEHDVSPVVHHRLPGILCPVRRSLARGWNPPYISDGESNYYKRYLRLNAETYYGIDRLLYHHMWNAENEAERKTLKVNWDREED
jgi:glycosyltransferase involved in cell wall biosynthesis